MSNVSNGLGCVDCAEVWVPPGAGPGGQELRPGELLSSSSPSLSLRFLSWKVERLLGSRLVTEFVGPLFKVMEKASPLPGWLLCCCFDFCEVGSYVALHSLKPAMQRKLTLNS